ncbi:hypothetical protein COT75_01375 [Candidatus Beckwithbacteria bacterium CG10_big_fil_rev_8_21_14_0_10_34_10]|uniref:TNase-like domain-containing protein n=1 Tax=Candidatus Beckwithbacteria bacterium CG10_big_fil_rev_8_21_14_0_10_34_10 TaxID=1974495 RepID=A0A2H0W9U7_9BACT|nr:MAG: hypothetical protein COT75_01375 [Candidatus Beckwithbacteria bacterium CG10_big_fil_rev_8_21_14_0_10_34_10]
MKKKRFIPWFKWLGFLLFIPSLFLNLFLFSKNNDLEQGIKVLGVIDGDTLVLDGKVRLRLRHLDAPELEYCGGLEAKEILESLVLGKKVVLKDSILDQQGRQMALVYVGRKLVNEEMLKSGWARYHHDQSSVTEKLKKVGLEVKEAGLGIFSSLCYQTENLTEPDCLIKGNIDKNSPKRLYYFPGCAQYDFTIVEKDLGEDWFCSEKEAQKAGFEKSKKCYGKNYE